VIVVAGLHWTVHGQVRDGGGSESVTQKAQFSRAIDASAGCRVGIT